MRAHGRRCALGCTTSPACQRPPSRRARSSRCDERPSSSEEIAAPDADSLSPASLTENPKPAARVDRKPIGAMRANGVGSVRLPGNTWTANLPTCWTEDEANPRLDVLAERAGRAEAARAPCR